MFVTTTTTTTLHSNAHHTLYALCNSAALPFELKTALFATAAAPVAVHTAVL